MLNFKDMIETAIRNQPLILKEDQRKGAPLCYLTKEGQFVILYPDGRKDTFDKPCLPELRKAYA